MKKYQKIMIAAVFWIGLWEIASLIIGKQLILPSFVSVLSRLTVLVKTGNFWLDCLTSLLRIMSGFAVGTVIAVCLAAMKCRWEYADAIITPFIRTVRATPVTSFIILIMLWTGVSYVPVVVAALMVMPVVYSNVSSGINETDARLIEVGKVFRFSRMKMLKTVYIPSVRPYFYSGALTALGLAWKSGIAAEVIALPARAIGSEMYYSKLYLETTDLFAWTVVVVMLSYLFEKLLGELVRRKGKENENK